MFDPTDIVLDVCEGKYTFVWRPRPLGAAPDETDPDTGASPPPFFVLRHHASWIDDYLEVRGSKAVLALIHELEELRQECGRCIGCGAPVVHLEEVVSAEESESETLLQTPYDGRDKPARVAFGSGRRFRCRPCDDRARTTSAIGSIS
jgi:hypothetical protein